jgi:hypothetical protein
MRNDRFRLTSDASTGVLHAQPIVSAWLRQWRARLLLITVLHGRVGHQRELPQRLRGSFVLNRWLNFRSYPPVGRQIGWHVAAPAVNYLAIALGVGAGPTALGVVYQLVQQRVARRPSCDVPRLVNPSVARRRRRSGRCPEV